MLCAVATAFAITFSPTAASLADTEQTIELTPVEIADAEANYRYFDGAKSVFADDSGIVVADNSGISTVTKAVSDGYIVTDKFLAHADKAYRHGKYFITLENGVIYTRNTDGEGSFTSEYIEDFDVENGILYAVSENTLYTLQLGEELFDNVEATSVKLRSDDHTKVKASAVAVMNDSVYVAVDSAVLSGNKQDICYANTTSGALTAVLMQSDNIYSLTAMDYSETLYTLTRNNITGYAVMGGGLTVKHSTHDAQTIRIFAHSGCIYALDALGALHELSDTFTRDTVLLASASDSDGFFNMPTAAAIKNSTLYVSDYINSRIAVYGKEYDYNYIDCDAAPTSIACDAGGRLYAAYENKVRMLSSDSAPITIENGLVKQIVVDADKRLYILANDGLYISDNGGAAKKVSDKHYKAIALCVAHDDLYAIDGTSVKKIVVHDDDVTETNYCSISADAFSLAVDLNGNVYTLSVNGITRTAKGGNTANAKSFTLSVDGEAYTLGFSYGQILLSTIENSYVGYGDIIIVDTYKHRVFTTAGNAEALDVELIDENYNVPNVVGGKSPIRTEKMTGLIRVALNDIEVFSFPMETPSIYTIAKGRKVIVPQYDLDDTREYALILIDNLSTGKLIQGYVHKDALSEPLPYVEPPSNDGTVYNSATPVYMWPSPNANTVAGYSAVERNTQFTVLDFVDAYRDDYGHLWYRISIAGGYEGYILGANLSLMSYEPVFIRPAYNAEIISYNGSESAPTYALEDGKYVELSVRLDTGTQVEVVGAFDSSERYTQIKYLDAELGTLTCYVETVYLKYNGVNIVLIVAVVVIVITVIIAAIIIWRVVYIKRRRLVEAPEDNGDE